MLRSVFCRIGLLILIVGLAAGCGARKEYYVDQVEVAPLGWDSLQVDIDFAWRSGIGGAHPAVPRAVLIQVFDARYGVLYEGPGPVIPIPDEQLGDRERITLEICGTFETRTICTQQVRRASPKRVLVEEDITYPSDGDYERGRYVFRFTVERERHDGQGWERIEHGAPVGGYLLARVGNHAENAVRVPFKTQRGAFNLAGYENYRHFKYYLDSSLLDSSSARVHFDVFAGLNGQVQQVASVEKQIVPKTREERADAVRYFVEQAAVRLVDELDTFLGGRRVVAYVDDWSFDGHAKAYDVEIVVEWRGAIFSGARHELAGRLRVKEDGSRARFTFRSGSGSVERRWQERIRGDVLEVGPLEGY